MENGTLNTARSKFESLLLYSLFLPVLFVLYMIPGHAHSFNVPERLEYDLKWIGIPGGTAVLSIENRDNVYIIRSRARSNKFISSFYKVDDKITCIVDGNNGEYGYSINYHIKLREGRDRKNKEVIFTRKEKKAIYIDHKKGKRREYEISENSYDPLSGFFSVRKKDLTVGKHVNVKIFDSKKMWDVKVDVLRKERVTVSAGTFDAIVIKPNLKSEGVFNRKGDILIWLTDDERKVPVKVTLEALIGHVTAELTRGDF